MFIMFKKDSKIKGIINDKDFWVSYFLEDAENCFS